MAKKTNGKLLENQINTILSNRLKGYKYFVLNKVRFTAVEFDLILLELDTLQLINIEIKRNKWRKLFAQGKRGKLYCHYSIVLMPVSVKNNISLKPFENEGIGVMCYKEKKNDIELIFALEPKRSESINRNFKKMLYRQVSSKFSTIIYA